jgi:hypothetical protein
MPRQLSSEEVSAYGLSCPSHQMDNDELRFRLMGSDGSGYIRTVAGNTGGVAEQPLPPRRNRVVRGAERPHRLRRAPAERRRQDPDHQRRRYGAEPTRLPPQRVHVRRCRDPYGQVRQDRSEPAPPLPQRRQGGLVAIPRG